MHILTTEQTQQIHGACVTPGTDAFSSPSLPPSPPFRLTGPGCIRPVLITDL